MSDYEIEFIDPTTGEQRDPENNITPGKAMPDALKRTPDPDFGYEEAVETWVGEPATVELSISSIRDGSEKRFALVEPSTAQETGRLLEALLNDDQHAFCAALVDRPALTRERWRSKLTGRERSLLYDHCYAWVRAGDYVTVQNILDDQRG